MNIAVKTYQQQNENHIKQNSTEQTNCKGQLKRVAKLLGPSAGKGGPGALSNYRIHPVKIVI